MSVLIKLSRYQIDKARKFVASRISQSNGTSLYKKRGGFKEEDLLSGALGELAIVSYLKGRGVKCPTPDFTIHKVRGKSYAADIEIGKIKIHVKSQTLESENKYGKSWLMQRNDPCLTNTDGNYLALTTVDLDSMEVMVHGFFSLNKVVENDLIGECKVPFFRDTKVAVYLNDFNDILDTKDKWGLVYKLK